MVISVSAWEAYVESLVLEVVNVIQPAAPPLQHWQSLNALVRGDVGRFNTPNTANVTNLFNRAFGLADVSVGWNWQNTTFQEARDRLEAALNCRHEIAHGVNPRPQVHNTYAARLPGFIRHLGRATDRTVRQHVVNVLGVANPWDA